MKRRKISPRKHSKSFQKKRNRMKAINNPSMVMRGGIRL